MLINHHTLLFISLSLYRLHKNCVLVTASRKASLFNNKKVKKPGLFNSLNIDFFFLFLPPCRIKPDSIEHCRSKFNTIDQSEQKSGGKRGPLPSPPLSTAVMSDRGKKRGKKREFWNWNSMLWMSSAPLGLILTPPLPLPPPHTHPVYTSITSQPSGSLPRGWCFKNVISAVLPERPYLRR